MFNPAFVKIKSILKEAMPYVAFIVILGAIGYFTWVNHNELEQAMVGQVKRQLLVTALAEAESIKAYANDTNISAGKIKELITNINRLENVFAFVVKDNADIVDYPYEGYVNKNILALTKDKLPDPDRIKLNSIIEKANSGGQGSELLSFFSEDKEPKIVKVLMAFTPIHIGVSRYSVIVVMEYSVIEKIVHKNAMQNLIFMGFACLMLIIFGWIFYRIHREKDKLALKELTLNIINKQLHSEIDQRKCTP